jgi:hypothetical protein
VVQEYTPLIILKGVKLIRADPFPNAFVGTALHHSEFIIIACNVIKLSFAHKKVEKLGLLGGLRMASLPKLRKKAPCFRNGDDFRIFAADSIPATKLLAPLLTSCVIFTATIRIGFGLEVSNTTVVADCGSLKL